jgi:hypothetical protein
MVVSGFSIYAKGTVGHVVFQHSISATYGPQDIISLVIHKMGIAGPTRTKKLDGEQYFMQLIDYYTRMNWVYFLKKNSEAFECFGVFKELVENEMLKIS